MKTGRPGLRPPAGRAVLGAGVGSRGWGCRGCRRAPVFQPHRQALPNEGLDEPVQQAARLPHRARSARSPAGPPVSADPGAGPGPTVPPHVEEPRGQRSGSCHPPETTPRGPARLPRGPSQTWPSPGPRATARDHSPCIPCPRCTCHCAVTFLYPGLPRRHGGPDVTHVGGVTTDGDRKAVSHPSLLPWAQSAPSTYLGQAASARRVWQTVNTQLFALAFRCYETSKSPQV